MAYTEQKELIFEMIQSKLGEIEIIDDETASQNFKDSLAIGHTSEDNVCAKIRKKYPKAHVIQGYFKGYDIYVPETGKKVEVKQDKKSNFTGNIVVEIEFNGKPSALSTTKADYWVFDDGETYMWITPDTLRQVIEPMRPVKFVGNGDNKEKLAYLVKKDVIINNCLKVDKYV
tara:strand:+ start:78 stop:596 length:519 start_codon:yes stop_codon:yes gene_type:complete